MREGPTSLCAALPSEFSSDDFRCKEQNTLALTMKILVVSNKKSAPWWAGLLVGVSGLLPHFSGNLLILSFSLSLFHLHATMYRDFIHKLQNPEKEKGLVSSQVSFL